MNSYGVRLNRPRDQTRGALQETDGLRREQMTKSVGHENQTRLHPHPSRRARHKVQLDDCCQKHDVRCRQTARARMAVFGAHREDAERMNWEVNVGENAIEHNEHAWKVHVG